VNGKLEKVWKKMVSVKIKMECPVHAMKITGRSAALIPRIAKLSTSGGELLASAPASLSREGTPIEMGDWMGSRVDWMPRIKYKSFAPARN
jgi:hypothetical protein